MSGYLDENAVEQYAIELLKGLGYAYLLGPDIAPGGQYEERSSFKNAVLVGRLRLALAKLNAGLPPSAIDDALRKVFVLDTTELILNNQRFHKYLIEGVDVEYNDASGSIRYAKARIVDFADPDANDWLVVNQFTIKEDAGERRPDLIVFVNGLPLGLFEFKNPADPKASINSAYEQLLTYKRDLSGLLGYNEILVVADGTHARLGSLTADWERFSTWKTPEGSIPTTELETLISQVFEKRTFLDIIRYFTLFEKGIPANKILAGYHQYNAVNKAIERTIEAASKDGDGKAGVVWHTTGSGKSFAMAFYAAKIAQQPELANPTLVVLTDRNDLDNQLFEQFMRCSTFLRQAPTQVETRDDLRDALGVASGHIVFTMIQKFLPEKDEQHFPPVTERRNVIVVADEAHRTQYGFSAKVDKKTGDISYGFARHLHDALPNASFIGFTGTPVEKTDHNTIAVFGDYIDIYDMRRAVDDGATVPIYYEGRIVKIALDAAETRNLDDEFDSITEDSDEGQRNQSASRWSRAEALVGAKERVDEIAREIVDHFETREAAFEFDGKAMIVCMSRRICALLYDAIVALRPGWHSEADDGGEIKVVITGSAADKQMLQPHIRNKAGRRALEKRFKDSSDPLKLVIVRDMWLTGFDVKAMHTMYVDKPMEGHNLIQAISRVNRVFKSKPGGLVVDFIGIAENLKEALANHTKGAGDRSVVPSDEETIPLLARDFEVMRDLFHGFPYQEYFEGTTQKKMLGLNRGADHVLGLTDGKARFLRACASLVKSNALASTTAYAKGIADDVAFFKAVRATIVKATPSGGKSPEEVDIALAQLVSDAVGSQGVVDILEQSGLSKVDISVLSDEFLADVAALPQRNLAREMLEKLLRDEIKARSKQNVVQARRFSEMLDEAINRYEQRSLTAVGMIARLTELAKALRDDSKRADAMGLSIEEIAFYDALASSKDAQEIMGNEKLRAIASELVQSIRSKVTVDWRLRQSARAGIRVAIRKVLRSHGYPPAAAEDATNVVLEQAELLCHAEAA